MPTSVSRLLEEAVHFLDTSNASKQGDVKESLESVLGKLKEVAAQRGGVGKVVVVVEVVVSEWVSIGKVASSVGSVGTVAVVSQAVVTQPVAVVKSISVSL